MNVRLFVLWTLTMSAVLPVNVLSTAYNYWTFLCTCYVIILLLYGISVDEDHNGGIQKLIPPANWVFEGNNEYEVCILCKIVCILFNTLQHVENVFFQGGVLNCQVDLAIKSNVALGISDYCLVLIQDVCS